MSAVNLKNNYENKALKAPRQSNLELLRIISMFCIFVAHYGVHGQFDLANQNFSLNVFFVQFMYVGGNIWTNIFILISGYFLVKSDFKLKRILKIELPILFYSLGFLLLFIIFRPNELDFISIVRSIFPAIFVNYGFATAYILFYLITPVLNKLIFSLDRETHLKYTIIGFFIWTVLPTITNINLESSNLLWYILLYSAVAYIRLYPSKWTENCKINLLVGVLAFGMIVLCTLLLDFAGFDYGKKATYFMQQQTIFVTVSSFALFLGFKNLKMPYSKFINQMATSTFGVFLIHENPLFRPYLWVKILKGNTLLHSTFFIPYISLSVVVLYFVFTGIDQLRILIVEKPLWRIIEPKTKNSEEKLNRILSFLVKKIQ